MNTKHADPPTAADLDDDTRPDTSHLDWSKVEVGRRGRKPGEKTEIGIDGAVGYSLRLIPSNKVLARFRSTLEAWPVIIATVEGGRSPRTLSLDWLGADGRTASISAGPRLERWARYCNGEPTPYSDLDTRPRAPSAAVETGRLRVTLTDGRDVEIPIARDKPE